MAEEDWVLYNLWGRAPSSHNQMFKAFKAMGMTTRTAGTLCELGFTSLAETEGYSDRAWLLVPNFGKVSLRELREHQGAIREAGDEDWW